MHTSSNLPLLDVPIGDYGAEEPALRAYREEGTRRALSLANRGPVRYTENGKLDPCILEAYDRYGFYILQGVFTSEELEDIESDLVTMLERCPTGKDTTVDAKGRPALGVDCQGRTISWVKPLSDPLGGTDASYGRHPAKMIEPDVPKGSPEHIVQTILGSLQFSEALLRAYGHPDLLAVAAAINGEDFTPFNEALWVKHPGLGGSVAWHQDGWTHWDSPELDCRTHGFNFMGQLYGCDAANGLWVVPGSHSIGKADIKRMAETAGSDRLPNAVPLICEPGDVAITNRQAIHGSFANTSSNVRVTVNMGFHRRQSVLGIRSGGVHNPVSVYDERYIEERSRVVMYGINARRARFPDETPFDYKPFSGREGEFAWGPGVMTKLKDYNLQDIGI